MEKNPSDHLTAGRNADDLHCPPLLLNLTFDQVRTLLALHRCGSPLRAAAFLGREHSSVRKQLDMVNRLFGEMCGEQLVVKQGRGADYLFTPSGETFVEVARRTLDDWTSGVRERRRRLGGSVTVATTEFTVEFLAAVWPGLAEDFARRGIHLEVVHVRSRDLWAQLDGKNVDLVAGSVPALPADDPVLSRYDVIEWHREDLALLTNLPLRDLPGDAVEQRRLPDVPLLAPQAGLIADFLRRWYGPDLRRSLRIVADVDNIYYGLALLRSGIVHGALVATHATAQAAVEGRLPGGPGLRLVDLAPGFDPPLQVLAGIFGRRGERLRYDEQHPLNLLWEAFTRYPRPAKAKTSP